MKSLIATTAFVAARLAAGTASAQCTESDGYVFITAQCEQKAADVDEPSLCQQAPDEDKTMLYFISNVIADEASDRSSLGSLFYDVVGDQYGVSLNGSSSQCFETAEAAKEGRNDMIERFRQFFSEYTVIVHDVKIDQES